MLKKIKRFLLLNDWIWSPIAAFAAFVGSGLVIQWLFRTEEGSSAGFYDPSFFQAAVYSAGVVALFSGAAQLGLLINFRGYWRWIYSKDSTVRDEFKKLQPWQKFLFTHFPLFFYLAAMLAVFSLLV